MAVSRAALTPPRDLAFIRSLRMRETQNDSCVIPVFWFFFFPLEAINPMVVQAELGKFLCLCIVFMKE